MVLYLAGLGLVIWAIFTFIHLPAVEDIWQNELVQAAAAFIAIAMSGSIILHFLVTAFLRTQGLWNPGSYHKWLWIPWRPIAGLWLGFKAYLDNEWYSGRRATGAFGGVLHKLCLVYKPGDVFLGRMSIAGIGLFQPLGQKLERHLFMFAGTGAGKTTLLITMLGLHPGNVFVIDPKGQMTKTLYRRRGRGGDGITGIGKDVAVLDPYNTVPTIDSACWNPLDEIGRAVDREGRDGAVKYAEKISEGLIRIEGKQPFFPKAARKFLTGLILHVYTTEPHEKRNMLRVYELVNLGYRDEMRAASNTDVKSSAGFAFLLSEMANNREYSAIASASTLFDDARSAGDVMSTLKVSLGIYDNEELRAISASSTFSLHDMKLGNQDVFVCAPTGAINGELSGWFRMLTVLGLGIFEYIPGDLKPKCFFAIDELPSLGNIEKLDKGPAVLRSYGIQLLGISQTVQALQEAYPNTWTTWVGNADAVYWMGTNDDDTAEYLAKGLGSSTRDGQDRWLLAPEQAKRYLEPSRGNMIVTRFGKRALKVKAAPYYKELPVRFYDADLEHREPSARARWRANSATSQAPEIRLIGQEIRKALAPPPKEEPINYAQAQAMFGLGEKFSRKELDARRRQMHDAASTPQMVEAVELAYLRLRESEEV